MSLIPAAAFPLSVSGAQITGADGSTPRLCGVNWGGAQQDGLLPYGLDKLPREQIISRITGWGLNHVRFPFSLGAFVTNGGTPKNALADVTHLSANLDLVGMTPFEVYCQLARDMTAAGLYVILNQHLLFQGWCCSDADNNGLWYNSAWPPSTFFSVWSMLASVFRDNPMVGYDLHNEPRPADIGGRVLTPSWGDGNPATDMREAYQGAADLIHAVHPGALVFCEGLGYGADLSQAEGHPVTGPGVVYSAHDYPWYGHPAGQSLIAYYDQMDASCGYLVRNNVAPVWIGEFGTGTDGPPAALDTGWFQHFLSYADARGLHTCWWELSATAVKGTQPVTNMILVQEGQRESYGLMSGQDWLGSQTDVLALLRPLMA